MSYMIEGRHVPCPTLGHFRCWNCHSLWCLLTGDRCQLVLWSVVTLLIARWQSLITLSGMFVRWRCSLFLVQICLLGGAFVCSFSEDCVDVYRSLRARARTCVCLFVCVCVWLCLHVCACVWVRMSVFVCVYVYARVCVYVCWRMVQCVYACTYVCCSFVYT